MENSLRSERSRNAAIQAALTIIARDGPARLTLDAIARESGISKGGVLHQFRTKSAVLKALLDHQIEYFEQFSQEYLQTTGAQQPEAQLSAQIATLREAVASPQSVVFALIGALAEDPGLLSVVRDKNAQRLEEIKAGAADPDLAMLRWAAAWGLTLTALLGHSPFDDAERERLFQRLLDPACWTPRGGS